MDVYVVVFGEFGEGYEIQGMYRNIGEAQAKVDDILADSVHSWIQISGTAWEGFCDYMRIEKYNLETSMRVPTI